MPLLSIEDLHVSFATESGPVEAVRGVSFSVEANQTVAVVGESGSGKTVISQAVLGILPGNARIVRGSIRFDDPAAANGPVELATLPQDDPQRRAIRGARISIIFQEPMSSLSPLHTIGDQIGEALALHQGGGSKAVEERTIEMLARVGFPDARRAFRLYPFELSGGLRQRAMIAMALVCGPALLIADEPTTALDVTIQAQILKLMKDLQVEFGMAILFISHDLGVVANIADEIVVMYRGRVMERGPCAELLTEPRHPYLQALLGAVPRLSTPADQPLATLRQVTHKVSDLMTAQPNSALPRTDASPILEIQKLRKVFLTRRAGLFGGQAHEVIAVDDVTFSVAPGECFAIVGESGSGKTTVSKLIMRALRPDGGRILYRDDDGEVDVLALDEEALIRFRTKIQYIFQDPFGSLNPRMTVYDLIAEPLNVHDIGVAEERRQKVRALLNAVGLDPRHLSRYPHSFSGGQRQRIGIARALALAPKLLICDEPVSALDVSVQAQILNLLKDLQRELGLTYLFISHNLAVVRFIAQRIGVMCAGRMVEVASTRDLFENPTHPYTRALLAAVPEPDLERPLDFELLLAGRASEPQSWPAPYTLGRSSGSLRCIEDGHFVRVTK
jgi:peptide/nickel transport system ATP-binding protein